MRPKRSVVIFDPWRNNHLNFFELNPKDIEIRETKQGKRLHCKRRQIDSCAINIHSEREVKESKN